MAMAPAALLVPALQASLRAGEAILSVYRGKVAVEYKADQSPLTEADTRSHAIIFRHLKDSGLPVLSEEGRNIPYAERRSWERLWIVDPLDGTKEFIKQLGEFTVNIAVIEGQRPVVGVIFVPVKQVLYFAAQGEGSFRIDDPAAMQDLLDAPASRDPQDSLKRLARSAAKLPVDHTRHSPFVIVGSRSHATPELHAYVDQKRRELGEVTFLSAGSSLKYCLVAEGRADVYPRLGPTMEWDTAAGQVIAEAAGATVTRYDTGGPMVYNKEDLLNPWHVVTRKVTSNE
ncbi:MAG: 3'(2'),5'-bisphosphate nucleotidase CysQ family protein [Hyphomicrobiales bacterium]